MKQICNLTSLRVCLFSALIFLCGYTYSQSKDSHDQIKLTSDVNKSTGQLDVSGVLLNIPAPNGSYPVSLSYQSGIRTNQEASWVGLGWDLTAGAIYRSTVGLPDDVTGVPQHIDNVGSVSEFSNTNGYIKNGFKQKIQIHHRHKIGDWGIPFNNQMGGFSPLNFEISQPIIEQSYVAPFSITTTGNIGNDFGYVSGIQRAVAFGAIIGSIRTYWQWFTQNDNLLYGSLYSKDAVGVVNMFLTDDNTRIPLHPRGDSYSVFNKDNFASTYTDYLNSDLHNTSRLPATDNYYVNTAGIEGSMRPVFYEQSDLFGHNYVANDHTNIWDQFENLNPNRQVHNKIMFRYDHDPGGDINFSNYTWLNTPPPTVSSNGNTFNSANTRLAGAHHVEWYSNEEIHNGIAKANGFIDYSPYDTRATAMTLNKLLDNTTSFDISKQIGGFSITNDNGTTYHFAIPVYSYLSQRIFEDDAANKFVTHLDAPVANSWLLTAITGSDYIDQNNDGLADLGDGGYWVSFDYGKWTDVYMSRNPLRDGELLTNNKTKYVDLYYQQLYYLDAIRTATHTALFEKDIRNDGKGATSANGGCFVDEDTLDVVPGPGFGFSPVCPNKVMKPASLMKLNRILVFKNEDLKLLLGNNNLRSLDELKAKSTDLNHSINIWSGSYCDASSTIVDNARLHNGDQVLDIHDLGNISIKAEDAILCSYEFNTDYSLCPQTDNSFDGSQIYSGSFSSVENGTIGVLGAEKICHMYMKKNPDASCPDFTLPVAYQYHREAKSGKLTLNSITRRGVANQDVKIPSVQFNYELDNAVSSVSDISVQFPTQEYPTGVFTSNQNYNAGDIVILTKGQSTVYGFIFYKNATFLYVRFISEPNLNASFINNYLTGGVLQSVAISQTKNGPGTSDYYDLYGYFKPDYYKPGNFPSQGWIPNELRTRTNIDARRPSIVSSATKDVWSLRKITSELGGTTTFSYETNKFGHIALSDVRLLKVAGFYWDRTNSSMVFYVNRELDLSTLNGKTVDIHLYLHSTTNAAAYDQIDFSSVTVTSVQNDDNFDYKFVATTFTGSDNATKLQRYYAGDTKYDGGYIRINAQDALDDVAGGIRVKKVSIKDETDKIISTEYEYTDGNLSSGSIILPEGSVDVISPDEIVSTSTQTELGKLAFLGQIRQEFSSKICNQQLLPDKETIIYTKVKEITKGSDGSFLGYTLYNSKAFDPDQVSVNFTPSTGNFDASNPYSQCLTDVSVDDDDFGQLLSKYVYDKDNSIISGEEYNYSSGDVIGKNHQLFFNLQQTTEYSSAGLASSPYHIGITSFKQYRKALISVHSFNNISDQTVTYSGFDPFSGQPLIQTTSNTYGDVYRTRLIPAYTHFNNTFFSMGGMGSKTFDLSGKNMLSSVAERYVEKKVGNTWSLVNVGVSGWNNNWSIRKLDPISNPLLYVNSPVSVSGQNIYIWRPASTWVWKGDLNKDGSYKNFVDFQWGLGSLDIGWQKANDILKYDAYSNVLESQNISNNISSLKFNADQTKVFAKISNANYEEYAFCGFEDFVYGPTTQTAFGGEIIRDPSMLINDDPISAHTGKFSLGVNSAVNSSIPIYRAKLGGVLPANTSSLADGLAIGKKYRASVWVYKDNIADAKLFYSINGSPNIYGDFNNSNSDGIIIKAGNWYLLNLNIEIPSSASANEILTVGVSSASINNFDDFRFQPINADLRSYVYDYHTGWKTFELDNNNFYTRYEYDAAGRVINTFKETKSGEKITSSTHYHYKGAP